MAIERYKKSDELVDASLEVMKSEIVALVQVVVDNIKVVDPKFPLGEVRSLWDFMESVYVCLVLSVTHFRSLGMLR